ncbi:ADP-ribose pyrophosphatase YjhB, NUDIX family [Paracoccus halophilus]|uniref:ADP-ribose pyrophosphatase YjhB, NUDIX family n=1 Tax=Paracoccus halophilus TaxID=376733 RepID=A0A099F1C5_9RHOB|nr:NUDIX hydrolase [Paracoccus halophilus]KGJ04485.1 NUDIX hydrolase [Paracoccus halophilus]SFA54473.1 ADP-ribose pyrophosphatase YjhB, NUDIX family [Paracoccus halophilus]
MIVEFRDRLARMIGRRPAEMQVAALCRDPDSGRILLITSRGTGRWILPKGWPMPGLSLADAAAQEAWEEAGAIGRVAQSALGRYSYDKEQERGFAIPIEVLVYPLAVETLTEDYPEQPERERRWFTPAEAAKMVAEDGLRRIFSELPAGRGH